MLTEPEPSAPFVTSKKLIIAAVVISSIFLLLSGKKTIKKIFKHPAAIATDNIIVPPVSEKKQSSKKRKKLYLTFDDGPGKGTKKVLSILKQEQVPATDFIIGQEVYGSAFNAAVYDSLLNCTWVELANHSYTHGFGIGYKAFYANASTVVADFTRCQDSLQFANLGQFKKLARTPGRNIWRMPEINETDIALSKIAADSLANSGFNLIGWDLEWHFDKQQRLLQSKEELLQQIDSVVKYDLTKTKNNIVLLMHDRNFEHPDDSGSLHQFIKKVKQQADIEFERVSNYPFLQSDTAIAN
jgi:peptidoglycan-N-acetylglucosamine deacetylase